VEGGTVQISVAPPIVLGPPLRGPNWVAVNGPDNSSGHRRALLPFNGNTAIGQRFAIDWIRSGPDGRTFDGDPNNVKSYRAYGQELLAVVDGVIASTKDGIPDNLPGAHRAVPIGPDTIAGNYVVLDVGGGRFAFYGHVLPGSLRVKPGEKVRRGHVLGLVGNSGNSDEPHLHFHVGDLPSLLEAEGLPYVIDSFETMTAPSVWQRRERELPLRDAIVHFP
jgi:murein DD-endopeptidase MepM/ murein hydrolase activator NlpD